MFRSLLDKFAWNISTQPNSWILFNVGEMLLFNGACFGPLVFIEP